MFNEPIFIDEDGKLIKSKIDYNRLTVGNISHNLTVEDIDLSEATIIDISKDKDCNK